jgi:hypothetical protein
VSAGLGCQHNLLAPGAEGRANHALIVAVLIAARGIEVVDPYIRGALNHAGVRGDHAAESNRGHLQPRAAQGLVIEFGWEISWDRRGIPGRTEKAQAGTGAGDWKHQPGRKELAARRF